VRRSGSRWGEGGRRDAGKGGKDFLLEHALIEKVSYMWTQGGGGRKPYIELIGDGGVCYAGPHLKKKTKTCRDTGDE